MLSPALQRALEERRFSEVATKLRPLLKSKPAGHPYRIAFACSLALSGELDEAMMEARRALHANPELPLALDALCLVLTQQDRIVEALAVGERAVALAPGNASVHRRFAVALGEAGFVDDALRHASKAFEIDPVAKGIHDDLVLAYINVGEFVSGVRVAEEARKAGADSALLAWNESLARIGSGDLVRGWDLYEHGFEAGLRTPHRPIDLPRWTGQMRSDQRVLFWREQGMGDEVLFLSCLPELGDHHSQIVLETSPRLVSLMQRSFPAVEVRPERPSTGSEGAASEPTGIDVHAPIGDLAKHLRRRTEDFPIENGYLVAEPDLRAEFEDRLASLGSGMRVGVSWRSGNLRTRRLRNYFTLDEMLPVLQIPGLVLVNLQYGPVETREGELKEFALRTGIDVHRWGDVDYTDDLESVAALTTCLDLTIGPASFPTVLAGGLGVRGYQLAPPAVFWGPGTPWFPSIQQVVRRNDESWEPLFQRIALEISREQQMSGSRLRS